MPYFGDLENPAWLASGAEFYRTMGRLLKSQKLIKPDWCKETRMNRFPVLD
jgi:hypothetical protein